MFRFIVEDREGEGVISNMKVKCEHINHGVLWEKTLGSLHNFFRNMYRR